MDGKNIVKDVDESGARKTTLEEEGAACGKLLFD